ncbi:MAG TPA: APC family permease, partial [Cryptosporangiaceae bacterium]|nr:APC family permease [Cryptosporangiaceae bacterium]
MAEHHETVLGRLAKRRLGVLHIFFFTVAASAPLTVLGGGVTTTYAVSGNLGVPLSFLILAAILGIFAVGYAAMSRHVSNAGAFYAYLANGLGRTWGVAASAVALLSYNAIQIGLYGLFGFFVAILTREKFGWTVPWWAWGLVALAVVGILGLLRVDLNARVLAVFLILEVIAVAIFDLGAFANPADGITATGLLPTDLFTDNVGAVFALGVAAFIGFESAAIYGEESKDPRRTVARATYAALAFTGIFYALSAWAMQVTVGSANVSAAAADPDTGGPGLVFGTMAGHWGVFIADLASVLFVTSVFAALLSFHNAVARYLFALGRERVLPRGLGRTGVASGAPVAGSLAQSLLAVVVVALFAILQRNPLTELFAWLSAISAIGITLLMAGTSLAVIGYFRTRQTLESPWQRAIAPALATVGLLGITGLITFNFESLLGGTA